MTRRIVSTLAAASVLLSCAAPALAWDAHGHRTITLLALDTLAQTDSTRPAFLATPESREMAAFQSSEPDRYRAVRSGYLKHENDPDHYIDVEDLVPFGLTLETVPKLRYEYLRAMAIAKHEHPRAGQAVQREDGLCTHAGVPRLWTSRGDGTPRQAHRGVQNVSRPDGA